MTRPSFNSTRNKKFKNVSIMVVLFIIIFIGIAITSIFLINSKYDEAEEDVLDYESYNYMEQDYIINDLDG